MSLPAFHRLLALCFLILPLCAAQAQALHPRWHGQWEGSDGSALSINAQRISTDGLKNCPWRMTTGFDAKTCVAYYSGTINKDELLAKQRQFIAALDMIGKEEGPQVRRDAETTLSRNKALLDGISQATFRTVEVMPAMTEDQFTGDTATLFFLDETTVYRAHFCEACPGSLFSLTTYTRVAAAPEAEMTPTAATIARTPPPPAARPSTDAPANARAQPESPDSSTSRYKPIAYTDFLLDHGKMKGQRIRLKASIQSSMNVTFLRRNELDSNPVMAEIDDLSREDRKKILTLCQHVSCSGEFYGQVQEGTLFPKIKIERIEWQGGANLLNRLGNMLGR